MASGTAGTLALALVAFALISTTAGPDRHVRTVAAPRTTTSVPGQDAAGAPGADTQTTTTGGGGGSGGRSSTTTVQPGGAGPRPPGAKPPAGSPGGVTSTTAAGSPGGDNTTAAPVACGASDLDYATATDKSSYPAGQPVAISLVVHNHSSQPCDGPGPCGVGPWAEVRNASNQSVWRSSAKGVACTNPPPAPPHLAPGQSYTYAAGTWDQQACPSSGGACTQSAGGSYRAIAHRGNATGSPAKFTT
jgi:hypothetical protein